MIGDEEPTACGIDAQGVDGGVGGLRDVDGGDAFRDDVDDRRR